MIGPIQMELGNMEAFLSVASIAICWIVGIVIGFCMGFVVGHKVGHKGGYKEGHMDGRSYAAQLMSHG